VLLLLLLLLDAEGVFFVSRNLVSRSLGVSIGSGVEAECG